MAVPNRSILLASGRVAFIHWHVKVIQWTLPLNKFSRLRFLNYKWCEPAHQQQPARARNPRCTRASLHYHHGMVGRGKLTILRDPSRQSYTASTRRCAKQRGKRLLTCFLPHTPLGYAIFPKRAPVAPKTRRGTGWSRVLAASPQALRVRQCPQRGKGQGRGLGKAPIRATAKRTRPLFQWLLYVRS